MAFFVLSGGSPPHGNYGGPAPLTGGATRWTSRENGSGSPREAGEAVCAHPRE